MTPLIPIDELVLTHRFAEAEAAANERIARARAEHGAPSVALARAYDRLAFVFLEAGAPAKAERALALALEAVGPFEANPIVRAELDLMRGRIALAQEHFDEAFARIDAASEVSATLPEPSTFHASVLLAMSELIARAGSLEDYVRVLDSAWKHSSGEDVVSGGLRLTTLLKLADAYLSLGQPQAVRALLAQARELATVRFAAYPAALERTESIVREILADLPDADGSG